MRPAVVNFCSTALDMLKFSTKMAYHYAGTEDFDYILVSWLPSPEVYAWAARNEAAWPRFTFIEYKPQQTLAYVPQLRAMMNFGFDIGYSSHDWVCPINTDMAFGRDWLANLVKHATDPNVIPNSQHITPVRGPNTILADFGRPAADVFDLEGFWTKHNEVYAPGKVWHGKDMPHGWEDCATFPYLLHESWWGKLGPWVVNHSRNNRYAPDRTFFHKCAQAGADFVLVGDSVCYHHEAVERRGHRPPGAEHLPEGS